MRLARLTDISDSVAATRSRLDKRALLAAALREAAPGEVSTVVHYLTGTLPQGRIGLGFGIVRRVADEPPSDGEALTLAEVDAAFTEIAAMRGKGSQAARQSRLAGLMSRASPAERSFLVRLILGELRQGALEGALVEAVAEAAALEPGSVRRAVMLAGEIAGVAAAALGEGAAGLERFRLEPLVPIQPMLAQPASDMDEALALLGEAALEVKLDGARVQIHKAGEEVRIFSRRLNEVTDSLPDVVNAVGAFPSQALIVDGEVIALREDGRPHPFQVTMSRFGRKSDVARFTDRLPLTLFLFDCLHCDGVDLIDLPAVERFARLRAATGGEGLVPRRVTSDLDEANAFLDFALEQGHEGVMAKSLTATYQAGSRGGDWLKVKPVHTLDLVVLAAEWGSGRRRGWLSNLHLGARDTGDAAGGGDGSSASGDAPRFAMLGKTFKGLTDEMLEWQTHKLLELEVGRDAHVVYVRPELVVEIAVNQIQTSPQYPAGMALRFARVKAYREDKRPEEADSVATVRAIHARQS